MGKQINYYMGYEDFLKVAGAAADCGCIIYKRHFENGHWLISEGRTVDIISPEHRDYLFYDPASGEMKLENNNGDLCISPLSKLFVIEAGFSVPDEKTQSLIRNRLYVISGIYDENGSYISRPESMTVIYNKLAGLVKRIAPNSRFSHYAVNPMYEGELVTSKEYISGYCMSLVKNNDLKLG